jgi:hypothetical protein
METFWEKCLQGRRRLFGQCLKGIGDPLGKAQKVLKTLWAMFTGQGRHVVKCP